MTGVKNNITEPTIRESWSNAELLTLYGQVLSQQQYEGSGIWSRFNILIGIDMSIIAAVVLLLSSSVNVDYCMLIIIIRLLCFVGLVFSIWSLMVLRKLWRYHKQWQQKLRAIEELFPIDSVKPFDNNNGKDDRKHQALIFWVKKATQPFFILIAFFWIMLIIIIH